MSDSYKHLEDTAAPDTVAFYDRHNQAADKYFTDSLIDEFAGKIASYQAAEIRGLPSRYGDYHYFVARRSTDKKLKVFVSHKKSEPEVLLDFDDTPRSLDYYKPSPNGKLVIYGTSELGNEQTTLRIYDTVRGADLLDVIPFAGYTDQGDICWLSEKQFVYPRMNGFDQKGPEDKWLLGTKLYLHTIGTDPQKDTLLFGADLVDTVMLTPSISNDSRQIYVTTCTDELTHQIYVVDIQTREARMVSQAEPSANYLHVGMDKLFCLTNYQAERYRLLSVDLDDVYADLDSWDEVLPESEDVLQDIAVSKTTIIAKYSHNVTSRLKTYDQWGNQHTEVVLPANSIVQALRADTKSDYAHMALSGFVLPTTQYRLHAITGESELVWARTPLPGDKKVLVNQEWATSSDGTDVPYFYIRAKDSDGTLPTVIYGYGGFNISLEPSYMSTMRAWVLRGGAIAFASLRGGSEFGEAWHRMGSMEHKQNTFDDCIAIAEDLVSTGKTSPDQLGVMGGSNGGLLVSAVTMQRPDLFRAGTALVPLTDMLEFYKHQVAEFWVHEYGDPRLPEQRKWIEKWSPYHYPIDNGASYPALYYETAMHDARVHPFHALKMVARLESEVKSWKGPLLLRSQVATGHQGSNMTKDEAARSAAEPWAFFAKELGL